MTQLKRDLGLWSCVLLVIGNIIGVGIFTTPGEIARGLPSAGWVLTAWALGGFLALAGALTYAELGAMYPSAGGNYVFIREAYGPSWAFVYGWVYSLLVSPGALALLALGFAEYAGLPTGLITKIISISLLVLLAAINHRGVKVGAGVMDVITLIKIVVMGFLVVAGFGWGKGDVSHFQPFLTGDPSDAITGIASALVPMAFAYSGWNATIFVSEEVKNPERLIPVSLIVGTLVTTALYMAMNAIYLYAVPLPQLIGEVKITQAAVSFLFGERVAVFVKALVATSVLGCLSASMLTNPRTTFALARDGYFFRSAASVHSVHGTPYGAIWIQTLIASVLIIAGNFEGILRVMSVPLVIIYTMTVLSIYVFRWKKPDHPRPYRCWGYPWLPAVYGCVSFWMLAVVVMKRGWLGPVGMGIFLLGLPAYHLWKRFSR